MSLPGNPSCRGSFGVTDRTFTSDALLGTTIERYPLARVGWLFDEQWFFDVDLEGKGGGVSTLPDRCP